MADSQGDDLAPEDAGNYKAPEKKTLGELQSLDKEDESLVKYKDALLAGVGSKPFPNDKRNLIVDRLVISVKDRPDQVLDLKGNISTLKKTPIVLKEGCVYKVQLYYYIQEEIVSGLKYIMATYRGPMRVDKEDVMLGSFGPKEEPHVWISNDEEAPKGMLARGSYVVKSRFTDDDKFDHLTWEWAIEIKKNWD